MNTSVKVIHRITKANLKGEAPLCLRITKNRKTTFISLGIYLHPKYWNEEEKQIRKGFPNSTRLNHYIRQEISDAQGDAIDLESKEKNSPLSRLRDEIIGKPAGSFLKFFERHLADLNANGQMGSLDKAQAVYSKLKKYMGERDLQFEEITVSWLRNYESHLRTQLGNSVNTIHSNLKIFRKLINDTVMEEIFPFEKNPFHRYKLKWQQVKKEYLTEEELQKLELLPLEKNSRKDHHRNMYVFAAYAGGLRISDILQLRWKNFDGEKLFVCTQKTSSTITIKLPNKSLEILERYRSADSLPSDFIFPILCNKVDYSDPRKRFDAISSATAYTNTDLKDIAKAAGIEKHIHFHTSRHTWATRALTKGMRIEHVSKLMGHNSIKTTQIYAKIVSEELDKAMEVFN